MNPPHQDGTLPTDPPPGTETVAGSGSHWWREQLYFSQEIAWLPKQWEPVVGIVLALFLGFLFYFGFLTNLENQTIDWRFKKRGPIPVGNELVYISITESCIEAEGPWPWPRKKHGRLLEFLREAGAAVVVFDILFSEASLMGPEDDAAFAEAVLRSGNVVLPVAMKLKKVLDNDTFEMVDRLVLDRPHQLLREPVALEGFIDMDSTRMNRDGVLRHVLLRRSFAGRTFWLLGLVAAAKYLKEELRFDHGVARIGRWTLPSYTRWTSTSAEPVTSFMVNYTGSNIAVASSRTSPMVQDFSYSDVLAGKKKPWHFKNKIVLIGTRAKGIAAEDVKFSPYGPIDGMEVHANVIHNVLSRGFLWRLPPWFFFLLLIGLSTGLGFLFCLHRGLSSFFIALGALIVYPLLGLYAFQKGFVLEYVPVLVIVPVQWAITRLLQQFSDLRQRNRELAKKVRELTMVNEVSQAVNYMGDLTKTLDTILSRAVQSLDASRGSLFLLDDRYENLVERSVVFGVEGDVVLNPDLQARFKIGEGIAGEVFSTGKPRLIQEVSREKDFAGPGHSDPRLKTMMCLPLAVRDAPIGVMNIVNKSSGRFDEEDLQLALTLANQAAVVVEKARLFNLATIDGLTGLIVHRHFQAKLEEEFRRAKRYEKPLSFLMTDIDHFKLFNDTWGHQTGDLVLREVAKCVRASIRDTDVAARYGGEEFAIILPETDLDGANLFAERLRQKVETARFQGPKGELQVTISLGLSSIPDVEAETALEMIKLADEALYGAKRSGRNRVGVAGFPQGNPASQAPSNVDPGENPIGNSNEDSNEDSNKDVNEDSNGDSNENPIAGPPAAETLP